MVIWGVGTVINVQPILLCMAICHISFFSESALSTQNLALLTNELASVTRWHNLGIKLGVPSHALTIIERDYPQDTERCKSEMLVRWLELGQNCSWRVVVNALHQMGMGALAMQIQRRHVISFAGMLSSQLRVLMMFQ